MTLPCSHSGWSIAVVWAEVILLCGYFAADVVLFSSYMTTLLQLICILSRSVSCYHCKSCAEAVDGSS
jgi:hypothetical protein